MKYILNMLICVFILTSNTLAQKNTFTLGTPQMKRLIGCWNDSESKEWRYGFFEKFAIYNNDFWEYQSLNFIKNKAEITLNKGEDVLKLNISFDSKADSICTITSSTQKGKRKFIRFSSAPDFTIEDHDTFIDNGYHQDSVTVIGYISNTPENTSVEITIPNFFNENEDIYKIKTDSSGRFHIIIPIINTNSLFIDSEGCELSIHTIAEPGDTLLLFYNNANNDTRIMGQNGRLNQELINYQRDPSTNELYKYSLRYDAKMDHSVYLAEQQKIYDKRTKIVEKYISRHPQLSDKFKMIKHNSEFMLHASSLMQRRFALRFNFNKEFFNSEYMAYVDQLYHQLPQPYTIYGNRFLTDYLGYYNNTMSSNCLSNTTTIIKYANKKGEYELTTQQKNDLSAYEHVMSERNLGKYFGVDSLEIERVTKPYKEAFERGKQLLQEKNIIELCKKYESMNNEIMELMQIQEGLICFDSIAATPILKELIATKTFCEYMHNIETPLRNSTIDYFKSLVSNESLRRIVLKQQEVYAHLAKQKLENVESLKSNDGLKNISDANELLRQIIAPYKGKVIYMDFWGTWCSPCKAEMKYTPDIKEALKDKEVIFMYLANNSTEDSWKNIIKENHLTGPNIVHYNLPDDQQRLLEKLLSINSFPTFILLDKEGNIIDRHAPKPSQKQELINRINELLTK
ncbi:TlpA family protein disulfide reductase [Bacteroides bouchesdurhonensis]|uniref:TlpA family protein disulfide reductase n=1 Tax=Bacteroides bouchesdurhonensis TaxID=1841855 RepID=UPI0009FA78E0|nr:TlpA disulfide reductase family protein [Bacteroides bouchesdurhonensis]